MKTMAYSTVCNSENLSNAIAWMRFPLILMIVMLHCYCAIDASGHSSYFAWVYPLGLWLGETGVPAFFFISGFLFFFSQKSYAQKLQTRFKTLLIPYLFWNALILLAYGMMEIIGHGVLIAGKNIADYNIIDYIRAFVDRGEWDRGNGVPMLCPYWYIRNLMALGVISPFLYYMVKYLKYPFILCLMVWWMVVPYNNMIASSLLFFCLGACFSIETINPVSLVRKFQRPLLVIWFIFFLTDWLTHVVVGGFSYGLIVHRMALVTNIFVLLLLGSYCGSSNLSSLGLLNKSAFWIYTVHYPLTIFIGNIVARYLSSSPDMLLWLFYVMSVFLVTACCVVCYMVLHKCCPWIVSFSTGNRS